MSKEESNWIIGRHPVREALEAEQAIHQVWIDENVRIDGRILSLAKRNGVPFKRVSRRKLELFGRHHQGVAAEVAALPYHDLWEVLANGPEEPLLVLLDQIEDPHNVGAIIRSAEALGATAVVTLKRNAAGLNATVAKASAGAVAHLPVCRVANLADTIQKLQKEGFTVLCGDFGGTPLQEADYPRPLAIVIGSEGRGVRRLVRERCDGVVTIPLAGKTSSLNASAAAAILLSAASSI